MPLQIIRQDITKMQVDAIVNTTNKDMIGYSGVDLAVHKKAGPLLDEECTKLVPLECGKAKITKGYNLDAKFIIHTSGPIWQGGKHNEETALKSCYIESLRLAVEYGCETVAFPLISAGAYGFPKDRVLNFAVQVISDFLFKHDLTVYICVFDRASYELSKKLFDDIREFIDNDYTLISTKESEEEFPETKTLYIQRNTPKFFCEEAMAAPSCEEKSFHDYMKDMDKPFAYKLFDLIDERNMTDVECYKKANIDKKTFSKIKCNPDTYKPSKQTAVAFAIALRLDIDETLDLLASAGLTLSQSFTFDKIIRYFIQKGNYNIFEINEALFEFDQVLLGC